MFAHTQFFSKILKNEDEKLDLDLRIFEDTEK
jgi:hypothetical protein